MIRQLFVACSSVSPGFPRLTTGASSAPEGLYHTFDRPRYREVSTNQIAAIIPVCAQ
jgi:hypothetical protein